MILAATLGATYGIYSGFELCENRAVPGHGGISGFGEIPVRGAVLVVVNLDVESLQHGHVQVPLEHLGLPGREPYDVVDLLDGTRYAWRDEWNYVKLDPRAGAAHIFEFPDGVRGGASAVR